MGYTRSSLHISMKIIAVGGFFHDLNFSYYDTDDENSLISVEEEDLVESSLTRYLHPV